MGVGEPSARTRVRRLPELARYDAPTVHAIVDAVAFCHVGVALADAGDVVVLPFLHARDGGTVYLHGSRANRELRALTSASRVCATFTSFDGLLVARTGFHSSVKYRCVVAFGTARLVEDPAERTRALDLLVEAVLPGRTREIRGPTQSELARTTVVALAIEEASAKVSLGPPEDEPDDVETDVWAGEVPAAVTYGEPVPATDGAMARGTIAVPASVVRLIGR